MKKMSSQQTTAALVIGFIIVAGGSFYGGMRYQQSNVPARGSFAQMGSGYGGVTGRAGGRGGMTNSGFASGSILSKDATSITINMRTGGSKIVLLSDKTQVVKAATGTLDDLIVGGNVTVTGTANSDGSVTAESVQVRPDMPAAAPTTPPATTPAVTQ